MKPETSIHTASRRRCLKYVVGQGVAAYAVPLSDFGGRALGLATTKAALVRTSDRGAGVRRAMGLLNLPLFENRTVFIKPNFNSAEAGWAVC